MFDAKSRQIFGERIKMLRTENGWTQEYEAKLLNISIPALSRYESGTYEPKDLSVLSDFAKLFKVTVDFLLGLSDERTSETIELKSLNLAFSDGFKGLNERNKQIALDLMKSLKASQEAEEK